MKANRGGFDDLEPSADLWSRIEKHLPAEGTVTQKREAKMFSLGFVLKVAASIILIMGVIFALYIHNEKNQAVDLASTIATKTIGRQITPDDHRRLLDESLAELARAVRPSA